MALTEATLNTRERKSCSCRRKRGERRICEKELLRRSDTILMLLLLLLLLLLLFFMCISSSKIRERVMPDCWTDTTFEDWYLQNLVKLSL
jgi:hypothetical protein